MDFHTFCSVYFLIVPLLKSLLWNKYKCAYYTNFGIAPYFKDSLLSNVQAALFYVTSHDKSLNRIFQEEPMDIHLRYFNEETQMVESRYLDSVFVKRPNSDNLLKELLNSLSVIGVDIQRSMRHP